jgi:hypothetical protein
MPAKSPGRKVYRSMRGTQIDMDMLRKKHELTPAVGNARVNARGDLLGPGGQIVKKREQLMKDYYKENPNAQGTKEQAPPVESQSEVVEKEVSFKKTSRSTAKTSQPTVSKAEAQELAALDDDWVEDENGNFVPKGE